MAVIWVILVLGLAGLVWFLFAPRNLQTLHNAPDFVDEKLRAQGVVDDSEDPRDVMHMAQKQNQRMVDGELRGLDTLAVPTGEEEHSHQGPINPQ
jgi:uncharacterized iron-regulated membrane protein